MIKPNLIFNYWRADDVAECMEGVSDTHLYATLWRDIVPLQSDEDFRETRESGFEALANYWHLLSESDQALLNEIAYFNDLHMSGQAVCLIESI